MCRRAASPDHALRVQLIASAEKIFELGLARIDKPSSVDHLLGSIAYRATYRSAK
jgi:hypothetical protein